MRTSHWARSALSLSLAALALACGASQQDGTDEMNTAIADAHMDAVRHAEACRAAPTLTLVMTELGRYEVAADATMARMDGALTRMSHCSGNARNFMPEGVFDARRALAEHRERLEAAPMLDDAHAACKLHESRLSTLLDGMARTLESMPCDGT